MTHYDHVIVGTGQATGTLLGRLIPTGDSIAVVEGGKVGGTCVNVGCTPTKTLVASARAVSLARRGDEFGFAAGPIRIDYPRIRERMNAIREGSSSGLDGWMESTENVTLIREWASFEGNRMLRVGEESISGNRIYINVGTRPSAPPIEGLSGVPWLDSGRLLDLEELPRHLVVIGGGYIGVELGQVYRRFGAEVTILQRGDQLMPSEDADVAASIQDLLQNEGIRVLTGTAVNRVSKSPDGVLVEAETENAAIELEGSHLMVAAGRRSNADSLKLENTSIEVNQRGFIQVDRYCQTAAEGVFALGDVNGHGAFTHTSVNDAEIVLDHLFGGPRGHRLRRQGAAPDCVGAHAVDSGWNRRGQSRILTRCHSQHEPTI